MLYRQQNGDPFKEFHNKNQNPNENNKSSDNDNNQQNDRDKKLIIGTSLSIIMTILYEYLKTNKTKNNIQNGNATISWNEFVNQMLSKGEVQELLAFKESEVVHVKLHPNAIINGKIVSLFYFI